MDRRAHADHPSAAAPPLADPAGGPGERRAAGDVNGVPDLDPVPEIGSPAAPERPTLLLLQPESAGPAERLRESLESAGFAAPPPVRFLHVPAAMQAQAAPAAVVIWGTGCAAGAFAVQRFLQGDRQWCVVPVVYVEADGSARRGPEHWARLSIPPEIVFDHDPTPAELLGAVRAAVGGADPGISLRRLERTRLQATLRLQSESAEVERISRVLAQASSSANERLDAVQQRMDALKRAGRRLEESNVPAGATLVQEWIQRQAVVAESYRTQILAFEEERRELVRRRRTVCGELQGQIHTLNRQIHMLTELIQFSRGLEGVDVPGTADGPAEHRAERTAEGRTAS